MRVLEIPEQLLGVLIHEILHDFLLQQRILSGSEPDHEELTDLASVLVGLAIPLANTTIRDQTHQSGGYSYWQIERVGYLTSQEFGYALALDFHLNRREFPAWARLMRSDAHVAFRDGLKFLDRTKDHFVCDRGDGEVLDHDPQSLGKFLSGGSPAQVLAALGWAAEHFSRDEDLFRRAAPSLQHRTAEIRLAAAQFLFGDAGADQLPALVGMCHDRAPEVAEYALPQFNAIEGIPDEQCRVVLQHLADFQGLATDGSPRVRAEAILCLSRFAGADSATRRVFDYALAASDPIVVDAGIIACQTAGLTPERLSTALVKRIRESAYQMDCDAISRLVAAAAGLQDDVDEWLESLFPDEDDRPYRTLTRDALQSLQAQTTTDIRSNENSIE